MAKNTVRDRIWAAAIDLAVNGVEERPDRTDERAKSSHEGVGFLKPDLLERVDAADRTVHDVLKTMVEMGLLGEQQRTLWRQYENEHGLTKSRRVTLTVYSPAGDIAAEPADRAELMGSEPYSRDDDEPLEGDLDEEAVAAVRDRLSL